MRGSWKSLDCRFKWTQVFVIVAESRGDSSLHEMLVSSQRRRFPARKQDRFSHSLLALLYDETGLEKADVICMECDNTSQPKVDVYSCTQIDLKGQSQCLATVFEEYTLSLSIPGHCDFIRWPQEVSIESPFHKSSYALLNEFQCQRGPAADVSILQSLYSLDGKYPLKTDLILQSRSEPMHVITSNESLLILGSAKDPYVTPFDPQVWSLLVAGHWVFVGKVGEMVGAKGKCEAVG